MRYVAGAVAIACIAGCGDGGPPAADGGDSRDDALAADASPTDGGAADAAPIDAGAVPRLGPTHELGLLPPLDGRAYNHSNEVQVAVSGERVAVAYLNLRFVSADSFDTDDEFIRTTGIAVSTDGGETYAEPVAPPFGRQTTDPNLRVDPDGTFWFATFDFDTIDSGGAGTIARSTDGSDWTPVVSGELFGDKNWMAIDPDSGEVFVGAIRGLWRIADGDQVTRDDSGAGQLVGGYARDGTVAFTDTAGGIIRWNGESAPESEVAPGETGEDFYHRTSIPLGPTADGGEWYLRATGTPEQSPLKVLVTRPDDTSEDLVVSGPDAIAFLPAADVDAGGRLHVAYYDSSGETGRVLYTRSLSSDFDEGFSEPIVLDGDATPSGFFPGLDTPSGARRVREYIDLQVAGSRAYVAWTHAPEAPSRVMTSYVVFE